MFEHSTADTTLPPDTRKQKNAMPPNFVHSLDSTHMMLTALHSHQSVLMDVHRVLYTKVVCCVVCL